MYALNLNRSPEKLGFWVRADPISQGAGQAGGALETSANCPPVVADSWDQNKIKVRREKQSQLQTYPLTATLGNALIPYLKSVRPACRFREVFITLKAPIKPLSNGALYHVVSKRIKRLGIRTAHRGPHALRQACATQLVSKGLSLKEIGDHLGHRSASATRIYAKVDLPNLRSVAAFNFGGVL